MKTTYYIRDIIFSSCMCETERKGTFVDDHWARISRREEGYVFHPERHIDTPLPESYI